MSHGYHKHYTFHVFNMWIPMWVFQISHISCTEFRGGVYIRFAYPTRVLYMLHISHIWMSHVTHMNKSCHTYEWVMLYMLHISHIEIKEGVYIGFAAGAIICSHLRAQVCVECQKIWYILLHGIECVFSHPTHYIGFAAGVIVCRNLRAHISVGCQKVWCILLHGIVCAFSPYTLHMIRSWRPRLPPSELMNESCHTYEWVMSHMWMSHVTLMNESCHTC